MNDIAEKWKKIFVQYREIILYLVFGALTTLVSIASFALLTYTFRIGELTANVFSWIISVMFAFLTNRTAVFNSKADGKYGFFIQMIRFFAGRIITLAVEEFLLWVFIKELGLGRMTVKIAAQILVIVLNYIISKFIIFKKK